MQFFRAVRGFGPKNLDSERSSAWNGFKTSVYLGAKQLRGSMTAPCAPSRGKSMTFQVSFLPKHLVRVGAVIVFAIGASACSSVPNWVDPTNWIGGSDDQPAPDQSAQAPDSGQTPDLSTIPDKPNAPSTTDDQ